MLDHAESFKSYENYSFSIIFPPLCPPRTLLQGPPKRYSGVWRAQIEHMEIHFAIWSHLGAIFGHFEIHVALY